MRRVHRGSDGLSHPSFDRLNHRRQAWWALAVVLLVIGAGAGGWWAAYTALTPQAAGTEPPAQAVWGEAVEGTVGRSLPYSTTLRQPNELVATNGLAGVVTAVSPGQVNVGDELYVVGDVPVRAVRSDKPMWRDLGRGLRGEDVRALQAMLAELGFFRGSADGDFGDYTERAVKSWQKAERRPETGVVQRGELVAFAQLPVVVSFGADIAPGKLLSGGEDAVMAPTGKREFVLVVTADQARQVPGEATVEITFEDLTWTATITGSRNDEQGNVEYTLAGVDQGEVCGDSCARLPLDPVVTLRSAVIVVPRVVGVAIPAAAVRTRPDGTSFVVTEAGQQEVTVRASGQGLAIVEGIELGTRVQLTGQQEAQSSLATPSSSPSEDG